jgi:hypothetical protein
MIWRVNKFYSLPMIEVKQARDIKLFGRDGENPIDKKGLHSTYRLILSGIGKTGGD